MTIDECYSLSIFMNGDKFEQTDNVVMYSQSGGMGKNAISKKKRIKLQRLKKLTKLNHIPKKNNSFVAKQLERNRWAWKNCMSWNCIRFFFFFWSQQANTSFLQDAFQNQINYIKKKYAAIK